MAPGLREELQATLAPTYRLEGELGGGGMSRVFLAEETRFRRKVVVKVLTPELAAGVSAERFEREILLAAQLVHPSIVPVLTAGEANGLPYYTMPFVDGESLRARLVRQSPLPINEAVSLLRDVARALAYAHERGIVHRDIKPENVLLSGGSAVVADFGIAKAISVARDPEAQGTLTTAGTSIGTPACMAPEQVTGDPTIGIGADLYSFGCVAFELVTGSTPFQGRAMHRIMAAHISEPAPDILARRTDCPPGLARLIMQCLEKEPEKRPSSAADLVRVLENTTTPAEPIQSPASAPVNRLPRAAAFVLGALVVLGGAWMLVKPRTAGDGAPAAAAGSALRSIAVLPFANVGGDTADAYFADGVGEELATALSKVQGLRVVARNSTFRSGGRSMDETEAGKALGVDALISGSVRRSGSQLRLTARLVRVSDGSILWSEQYANEVKDVFAVQDSVTRSIVSALQLQLAGQAGAATTGRPLAADRGTSNLAAYDLYLRGQFALHRRHVQMAVDFFRQAIALDQNYARAYAGLSAALVLVPYFAEVHADSVREPAAAAARRALAIDSTLAEAHTSLGLVYMHANRWAEAEVEHREAIALDPTDAAAFVQYGRMLLGIGRLEGAASAFERAESLDPFSAVAAAWVSNTATIAGKTEAALAAGRRAVALDSNVAPAVNALARAFLAAGRKDSAMIIADRLPLILPWIGIRGYIHAKAGDPAEARRLLNVVRTRNTATWGAAISNSWIQFGLGDTAKALSELERSTTQGEIWTNWYGVFDAAYDQVRTSPHFAAIVQRVGLDVDTFNQALSKVR
jgi:serine/threonine-protein kinase